MNQKSGGLAGVVVGDSAICTVGQGIGLNYRGYSIDDLAKHASFEEVCYLLIYGELPNKHELQAYQEKLMLLRSLPEALKIILENIPKNAHPMDVLRTGISMLGTLEPENSHHQQEDIADRLLALTPGILLYWYHFQNNNQRIKTQTNEPSLAGHFLYLLHDKKPSAEQTQAMNVSLILYAEHEYNASTFAARVTTSTLSDFYSAIISGVGTLRGPLHGGANEAAMDLIAHFKTPEAATTALQQMLAQKAKIMGFGHRVYKTNDPRSDIIKKWSKKLSLDAEDKYFYAVSEAIEKIMWDEKKLFPNVDFYSASTYHFLHIPTPLFTAIFVMSRISGWSAHIIEQRNDNRLIRPDSNYTGPEPRPYLLVDDR